MKKIGLLLSLFLIAFVLPCSAQSCNGILGDTVININFGSGAGRGDPLPSNETNYLYAADYNLSNGKYSILNTTAGFYSQWFTISDHTGNPNGFMLVMNCNNAGDLLYKKQMNGLCPNTTYQLALWVINLVQADLLKGINVNLTFSVETAAGVVLNTYNTGDITESNTPDWKRFGVNFTTPLNSGDIILKIISNNPGGDGNDVALDDITLQPCVPIINASFKQTKSSSDITLCQGSDAVYNLTADIGSGYSNPAYQWQINMNGLGWNDIPGEKNTSTTVVFKSAQTGNYQYRLATAQTDNINLFNCRAFSNAVTINVIASPVPSASANSPVCEGSTLNLSVANGVSYQWTGPGGFTSSQQNPSILKMAPAQAGMYRVTLTSATGCAATDSVNVVVNPKTPVSAGADVSICKGSSTVLSATGGISYRWQPALGLSDTTIANPVASPAAATTYIVNATNQYGCVYMDSVKVTVTERPIADAGPDKKVSAGKSVRLSGKVTGSNFTFYWSPNTYLSSTDTLEPLVTPVKDITYTLHVVSKSGCSESVDSVQVQVYQELVVPNTFTPNGDGINDTWHIPALEAYPGSVIEVYNRYGKRIFRTVGNDTSWDGTINGQPLPVGTYYYKIDNADGTSLKSGWVFLAR